MEALLAFALALHVAAPALACDVDDCSSPPLVLPRTENVPVNAFAFEVTGDAQARLLDRTTNTELPASVKWAGPDQVWSPDVALQVGQQLRVSYRTSCPGAVEVGQNFVVAPEAALDRAASVQLVERFADAPHGERRIYANLSYQPPSSAENYLRLRIEVDGLPYQSSSYYAPYAFGELSEQLWARCDAPPNPDTQCGGYDALTARKHEVKLIARALGSSEEHVETIEVDLRCEVKSEDCALGSGQGGWMLLLFALRRRRQGTSSARAASTSARV